MHKPTCALFLFFLKMKNEPRLNHTDANIVHTLYFLFFFSFFKFGAIILDAHVPYNTNANELVWKIFEQ